MAIVRQGPVLGRDETGKPVVAEDVLWEATKEKGSRLWFVEREGPKSSAPDATGDEYEVFEVITDTPQKPSDMAGYIKRVVPLGVQDYRTGVVAAGA